MPLQCFGRCDSRHKMVDCSQANGTYGLMPIHPIGSVRGPTGLSLRPLSGSVRTWTAGSLRSSLALLTQTV